MCFVASMAGTVVSASSRFIEVWLAGIASAYKPSRDRMEKKKTEGLTRVNGVNTTEPVMVDFLCTNNKSLHHALPKLCDYSLSVSGLAAPAATPPPVARGLGRSSLRSQR